MKEWILRLTKSLRQRLHIFASWHICASLLVLPAVTGFAAIESGPATVAGAASGRSDPATVTGAASGRSGRVTVTVHLRDSLGSPIAGETVLLERLPTGESEPAACVTDADGVCAWRAAPGLYQLFFERPLDEVTQLALAEGGLRRYGITVGERSVSYHFTFHHDGLVYFDSEPSAPVPVVVVPSLEDLHLGHTPPATATAPPDETGGASTAETPAAQMPASATAMQLTGEGPSETPVLTWLLFLSIAAGLLITIALPLMLRLSPPGAGSCRMDSWTTALPHNRVSRAPHRKAPSATPEPEDSDA
jgi:hypothetical protein